jgi:hypothetical protein
MDMKEALKAVWVVVLYKGSNAGSIRYVVPKACMCSMEEEEIGQQQQARPGERAEHPSSSSYPSACGATLTPPTARILMFHRSED